jgi:membrane associated rhomboid family serine protease
MQLMVEAERQHAEQRFIDAFFSRATPVTYALLGFNLGVYVVMTLVAGGNFAAHFISGVDPETLIAFGAKTNELLTQRGEWFRFVTPIFIHGGLLHIVFNSYALYMVGPQVERLYGSARYALIYLLAGIGGVIGSYLGGVWLGRDPTIPSVGASGAIFGLFGVLAVFGYKYRHELPPAFRRSFGAGVLPVIAVNLLIGFSVPVIDNAAHIGGLLVGALLALLIPYVAPGRERAPKSGMLMLGLCLAVVLYCFARAARQSGAHLSWRQSIVESYLENVNGASQAMRATIDPEVRGQGEAQISEAIAKLEASEAPSQRADEIRRALVAMLRRRQELIEAPASATRQAGLRENAEEFGRISRLIEAWVRDEGARHGLRLQESEGSR